MNCPKQQIHATKCTFDVGQPVPVESFTLRALEGGCGAPPLPPLLAAVAASGGRRRRRRGDQPPRDLRDDEVKLEQCSGDLGPSISDIRNVLGFVDSPLALVTVTLKQPISTMVFFGQPPSVRAAGVMCGLPLNIRFRNFYGVACS